jgi:hypothetical protein
MFTSLAHSSDAAATAAMLCGLSETASRQLNVSLEVRACPRSRAPAEHRVRAVTMGRLLRAMSGIGMTCDCGHPPRFPLWSVYGVAGFDAIGAPEGHRAAEYQRELQRILSWHGDPALAGIPEHKLAPPQVGWHVTALECAQALTAYRRYRDAGGTRPRVFGGNFVPFLRVAREYEGFEVH